MASVFTKIIGREISAYIVAEDENNIAFLDVFPIQRGHTLVVPKFEKDKLFDLDNVHYTNLMLFSKKVAQAMEKTFDCNRIGVSIIGLEVPHAHVHLIPISSIGDMNFSNPKLTFIPSEFESIRLSIQKNLEA